MAETAPESTRPHPRVQTHIKGKSLTEQSHKGSLDINNIVKRYYKTGTMPQRMSTGLYGDFTNVEDYHTSVQMVKEAHEDFMALPSELRKEFNNDPAELLEFVQNPDNAERAIELGILPQPEPVSPEPTPEPEPVPDPPAE